MALKRFAAVPDLHCPLVHRGYFEWLIAQLEEFRPDVVVLLGDLYEGLAASRHARDPRHDWTLFDEHRSVAEHVEGINGAAPGYPLQTAFD